MTVAMNDIFNDVDFSKVDDKVDELKDSLDELEDAAEQLVDGSSQLYDGIGTLLDKSAHSLKVLTSFMTVQTGKQRCKKT